MSATCLGVTDTTRGPYSTERLSSSSVLLRSIQCGHSRSGKGFGFYLLCCKRASILNAALDSFDKTGNHLAFPRQFLRDPADRSMRQGLVDFGSLATLQPAVP